MRRSVRLPSDALAATIVVACNALLPIVKVAKLLLRRKQFTADELTQLVPGLETWPARHGFSDRGADIALDILAGQSAYDIVARVSGTRRSGEQVKALYRKWIAQQPRGASISDAQAPGVAG